MLCEAEQAEREIGDSWDEELRAWLARPVVLERTATGTEARVVDISKGVKPSDALRGILGPDSPKAPRSVEMRLAECFRRLGYEQTLLSVGKARPRVWRPKTDRTDQRSTSFPKLPESVQQCAVQHSAAPPTPSLSTLPIKVDRVDRVDQTLGNQDSKFDQPPINHQPKVDQNGQSGTKQYLGAPHPLVSSALELPESFFEGTDFASEVDRNSEPANAVEALACTCLAGAGEPHADWCGEQRGAAE